MSKTRDVTVKIDPVIYLNVKSSVYGQPLDYVIDSSFIDLTYQIGQPESNKNY